MTQQHLNEVKRECFAEVVKFADELEDDGNLIAVSRTPSSIKVHFYFISFSFDFAQYDTTAHATREFHKQFNKFKSQCKTNN